MNSHLTDNASDVDEFEALHSLLSNMGNIQGVPNNPSTYQYNPHVADVCHGPYTNNYNVPIQTSSTMIPPKCAMLDRNLQQWPESNLMNQVPQQGLHSYWMPSSVLNQERLLH